MQHLAAELEVGRMLSGSHRFGGVDNDGRIHIITPERVAMKFRVAPGLGTDSPLRLVLESRPPSSPEEVKALTLAMSQVRGVMRAVVARR